MPFGIMKLKDAGGVVYPIPAIKGDASLWYSGTAVTGTTQGITAAVTGSKKYDMYLNTTTKAVYQASNANTWNYLFTMTNIQYSDLSAALQTALSQGLEQVKTGSGTLTAVGWSLAASIYSQNIVDAAITAAMDVDVTIADASLVNAVMGATKVVTYAGGFTVKCTILPTVDLSITYVARKVGM